MARKKMSKSDSHSAVNHQIFSLYSLTISFVYMIRVVFELATQTDETIDVQWQVTECLFIVFGVLISIAMHNAYDTRISFISICWIIWMFINTIFALFAVNSDVIRMVVKYIQSSLQMSTMDVINLILDTLHFFNIPISLYFICVFLVSTRNLRKSTRRSKRRSPKVPIKKQFEVASMSLGDEMVYYV